MTPAKTVKRDVIPQERAVKRDVIPQERAKRASVGIYHRDRFSEGGTEGPGETPRPTDDVMTPPIVVQPAPVSHEVALRELGAAIAAAIHDVQLELARYPSPLGAYVLDELEIALPVMARIDDLGQTMVTVVSPEPGAPPPPMVRFKLRPQLGAPPPPVPPADAPLSALGVLSAAAIARLQERRIFSIAELRQVTATAAGAASVEKLELGVSVPRLVDRARLFELPGVPREVSVALVQSHITSPEEFARTDPGRLAALLAKKLSGVVDAAITPEVASAWQQNARSATTMPLPHPRPIPDR